MGRGSNLSVLCTSIRFTSGVLALVALVGSESARAQESTIPLPEIHVISTTPLPAPKPVKRRPAAPATAAARGPTGSLNQPSAAPAPPGAVDIDKVPANVQTLSTADFDHATAPSLLDDLARDLPGVALSDQTGNQFQLDLNYRGFVSSPVIGTPQGLAVYQNRVRINEVLGDIVNWDFIPEDAIRQMTLMPSDPIYGLNAIGGALSFEMKNGFTYQGAETELSGGSFGRIGASMQAGGQSGNLSGYVTADAINDGGWRQDSPSQVSRLPGDHLTGIPYYRFKLGAEYQITDPWRLGADLNVIGSQYLVGDESNQNPQVPAYWVANLHTSYKLSDHFELFGQVKNLFDQHYYVYGTFFQTSSFPYLNLTDPRTFLPGMPFAACAGIRATL